MNELVYEIKLMLEQKYSGAVVSFIEVRSNGDISIDTTLPLDGWIDVLEILKAWKEKK